MKKFRTTVVSTLMGLGLLTGLSVPSFADDTELYLGHASGSSSAPNVLFVLDRSGSMGYTVSGPEAPVLGGIRRFDHLRDALLLLLQEMNNVNVGFMTFSDRFKRYEGYNDEFGPNSDPDTQVHYNIPLRFPIVHIDTPIDQVPGQPGTSTGTVRDYLSNMITNMDYSVWTPLVPAILEAGMYYTGGNLLYGDNRRNKAANRVAHPGSYTGGTVVRDEGCTDEDLGAEACKTETIQGTPVYNQPSIGQCQPNFIVFLTDGEANKNYKHTRAAIETFISGSCQENYDNPEKCGVDMVEALYNIDLSTELPGKQNVVTHTIAFALEAQSGKDYMQDWATAGGGDFYSADNALELVEALKQILVSMTDSSTSFAPPSVSIGQRFTQNNDVYFSIFKPEQTAYWPGNIKKYSISDGTGDYDIGTIMDGDTTPKPAMNEDNKISDDAIERWNTSGTADGGTVEEAGAGAMLQQLGPDDRNIFTNKTDSDQALIEVITSQSDTDLSPSLFGVETTADRDILINWMRGYKDGDTDAGSRDWILADSLHSSPGAITTGKDGNNPINKVFVINNEGALRMLNADTGAEEWMFIPKEMLAIQQTLKTNPSISSGRTYGLDGNLTFIIKDANKDGIIYGDDEYVKLMVTMRRGGRNIYALNVTPDQSDGSYSSTYKPSLMWSIKGGTGDFVKLGQTWSTPKPTKVRFNGEKKTVLLFGGGYEAGTQDEPAGTQDEPGTDSTVNDYSNAIYMVDPEDGSRLWWVSKTGADLNLAGMDYSIPSDLALMDSSGNGLTDRIYVGDTGGQIWRIDLGADLGNGGNGIGGMLASLGDKDSDKLKHKRRFFYAPDVVQLKDASSEYDLVVIASGYRPNPLGTYIQDRFYALRDRAIDGLTDLNLDGNADSTDDFFTLTHPGAHLFNATTEILPEGILPEGKSGWYIDLEDSGEKSLASPFVLQGKVYFTTFVPASSAANSYRGKKVTICHKGQGHNKHTITVSINALDAHLAHGDSIEECKKDKNQKKNENKKKITICHYPPGNPDNAHTITISENARKAHKGHGDTLGECPTILPDGCSVATGTGKLYALDILTGAAASNYNDSDEVIDKSDRSISLGEGIPSQVVPFLHPEKEQVTLLVGTGGGIYKESQQMEWEIGYVYWIQK